jgi:hypothetical protein
MTVKYYFVASIAVILAWYIFSKYYTEDNSVGTLLISRGGKPSESGYIVNNNDLTSNTIWTSDKIMTLFKNIINDNAVRKDSTFSSQKIRQEIDKIINDGTVAKNSTFSSEKILSLIQPQVFFDCVINKSIKVNGVIVYDSFITESPNSGMNLSTGIFTCPKAGLYRLTFTGLRYYFVLEPLESRVRMVINNVVVATTATTNYVMAPDLTPRPPGGETLNINILRRLNVGDQVLCRIDSGGIFDMQDEHMTHFTAELLI